MNYTAACLLRTSCSFHLLCSAPAAWRQELTAGTKGHSTDASMSLISPLSCSFVIHFINLRKFIHENTQSKAGLPCIMSARSRSLPLTRLSANGDDSEVPTQWTHHIFMASQQPLTAPSLPPFAPHLNPRYHHFLTLFLDDIVFFLRAFFFFTTIDCTKFSHSTVSLIVCRLHLITISSFPFYSLVLCPPSTCFHIIYCFFSPHLPSPTLLSCSLHLFRESQHENQQLPSLLDS